MYQRRMSEGQFAEALEELEVTCRTIAGPATITTGESEKFGAIVLVQAPASFHAIYEIAQGDEPDIEPTAFELAHFQRSLACLTASISSAFLADNSSAQA